MNLNLVDNQEPVLSKVDWRMLPTWDCSNSDIKFSRLFAWRSDLSSKGLRRFIQLASLSIRQFLPRGPFEQA